VATWAALLAGTTVLFGAGLGARDLWNPNEPLYGQAVVEMAASGERLLPTVNGERFAEKPPLYFWLALAASRVTGRVDEGSLRVPSVLAGLAAVTLLYSLVERMAGRRRAWITSALFATTFSVAWAARSIQMDLLLGATTLAALHAALVVPRRLPGWLSPVLAGASAGLGVLAKGPVGILCPALVLGADAALGGASRRCCRPQWLAVATATLLAVAAPWYVALALGGESGALGEVLWRQNVTRFFTPWDHVQPVWYYLGSFWLESAPWGLIALLALGGREPDAAARALDRLAWVWLAVLVAFFSLSASKRGAYLLPAMPAVAILASGVLDRVGRGVAGAGRKRSVWVVTATLAWLLALGGIGVAQRASGHASLAGPARAIALVLVAGAAVVTWTLASRERRPVGPTLALAATVAVTYVVVGAWAMPAANPLKSARGFCTAMNERVGSEAPLRSYGSWKWRASYVYYARRRIPRLESEAELRAYFAQPETVFLIVERGSLPDVRRVVGAAEPVLSAEIGANAAYVFTNRGATTRADPRDEHTRPTATGAIR